MPTDPMTDARDAARYRWLRSRSPGELDAQVPPGLFIGRVPQNVILTGDDADRAIDRAIENGI